MRRRGETETLIQKELQNPMEKSKLANTIMKNYNINKSTVYDNIYKLISNSKIKQEGRLLIWLLEPQDSAKEKIHVLLKNFRKSKNITQKREIAKKLIELYLTYNTQDKGIARFVVNLLTNAEDKDILIYIAPKLETFFYRTVYNNNPSLLKILSPFRDEYLQIISDKNHNLEVRKFLIRFLGFLKTREFIDVALSIVKTEPDKTYKELEGVLVDSISKICEIYKDDISKITNMLATTDSLILERSKKLLDGIIM